MKQLKLLKVFFILSLVALCDKAVAQYNISQIDPCYLRWKQIVDKKKGAIVFPDYILDKALEMSFYRDMLTPYVDYAIPTKLRRFDISLHPTTMLSNGMVTYTPSRMELYTMPGRNNYSLAWSKQLMAHEYRHVAQLSNISTGFTKVLSYILGEQMLGITAILIPTYYYEGDATAAETEFAMYGRGKQPSFHILLRAMANEDKKINTTVIRLGAFNKQMPSAYELGYFTTRFATQYYGDDFWSKVLRYAGRNPYFIDPCYFAYRKYGNKSSSRKLINRSFDDMRDFWQAASAEDDNSDIIQTKTTSYTTYSSPLPLDSNTLLAYKVDLDRSGRFVAVDMFSGKEKVLHNTGYMTSNPVIRGGNIYWCEHIPSLSWGLKNSSVIFSATIRKYGKSYRMENVRNYRELKRNCFFVTPVEIERFAMVDYDKKNNPSIVITDKQFNELKRYVINISDISFNGLTWDDETKCLYAAIVDDRGTSLVRLNEQSGELENLMPSNYGTITNLTASGGKLYYSSIDTGKDEVHIYDLKQEKEYQLTSSKYGSEASVPQALWSSSVREGSQMLLTTFTRNGYMLSTKKIEIDSLIELSHREMPSDRINYPFKSWGLPKLDTINFTSPTDYASTLEVKKYNKLTHAINVHSWMPLYLDASKLVNNRNLSLGLGVNILSQNILNTVVSSVGYGLVGGKYNLFEAGLSYKGLPVHFSANFSYGGGRQLVVKDSKAYYSDDKNYMNVSGQVVLPLNLSSGGVNRYLNIGVSYDYENTLLQYNQSTGFDIINRTHNGIHKMGYYVNIQSRTPMTKKNMNPRLGYTMQIGGTLNPFSNNFSNILYIYGKGYVPGPLRQGSISFATAYQHQSKDIFWYQQSILFPKGVDNNFYMKHCWSMSADYRVPLFYPNWGLETILHLQRVSARAFFDYAITTNPYYNISNKNIFSSYGTDLMVDFNIFGISQPLQIILSGYKPSDKNGLSVGVGFNLNF